MVLIESWATRRETAVTGESFILVPPEGGRGRDEGKRGCIGILVPPKGGRDEGRGGAIEELIAEEEEEGRAAGEADMPRDDEEGRAGLEIPREG